jgi:hypothetical protein
MKTGAVQSGVVAMGRGSGKCWSSQEIILDYAAGTFANCSEEADSHRGIVLMPAKFRFR